MEKLQLALVFGPPSGRQVYVSSPESLLYQSVVKAGADPEVARQALLYIMEGLEAKARRK